MNANKRVTKGQHGGKSRDPRNSRSASAKGDKRKRMRDYIKDNPRNYQDDFADKEKLKGDKIKTNDPSWYNRNPQLTKDAANLVFGYPAGFGIKAMEGSSSVITTGGVLVNYIVPSIGPTTGENDPANICAMEMFNFVRREQTGTSPFEQTDLFMYALGAGEIYSYIMFLQRLYGLMDLLSLENSFVPEVLFDAQNVDLNDLQTRRSEFRAGINLLINYAAAFKVPSTLEYFKRKAFMYANVYSDSPDIKGTIYLNVPAGFYMWKEGDTANPASSLVPTQLTTFVSPTATAPVAKLKMDQLLTYGFSLIQQMRKSGSIQYMSAAILKAFGEENTMKLATMGEIYPIVPLYDTVVLEQFKNALVMPALDSPINPADGVAYNMYGAYAFAPITQTVRVGSTLLQCDPRVLVPDVQNAAGAKPAITAIQREVALKFMQRYSVSAVVSTTSRDPATIMDVTRLAYTVSSLGKDVAATNKIVAGKTYSLNCGTEIVIRSSFRYISTSGYKTYNDMSAITAIPGNGGFMATNTGFFANQMQNLVLNGRIDYSPFTYVVSMAGTEDGSSVQEVKTIGAHFDFNDYSIIHPDAMEMMRKVALLSLLQM